MSYQRTRWMPGADVVEGGGWNQTLSQTNTLAFGGRPLPKDVGLELSDLNPLVPASARP